MTTKKSSSSESKAGSKAVVAGGAGVDPTVPGSSGTPTTIAGAATAVPPKGFEGDLQQMLQGFQNFLPAGTTVPSSSGGFSRATVIAQLEAVLALYPAIVTAKKATSQAVANLHSAVPGAHALLLALKDALIGFYGRTSPTLSEFGVAPKARAKPSSLQSAVTAAKARQTRQANGTLGKRQKAQLALAAQAQSIFVPQGTSTAAQPASPAAPAKPTTSG